MGYGDYLMLSGKVRVLKQTMPNEQLCCPTLEDRFYFESVFFNNQNIVRSENIDNSKPLLELGQLSLGSRKEEASFIDWNVSAPPIRGDIYFTKDELNIAENFISDAKLGFKAKHKIDPLKIIFLSPYATTKRIINGKLINYIHSKNKEWLDDYWQELILSLMGRVIFVSTVSKENEDRPRLPYVDYLYSDFRLAAALLKYSDIYVGIEGGLHHAAAALKKPGIVIFGHWISPMVSGYSYHTNFYDKNIEKGCGSLTLCQKCLEYMKNLSTKKVLEALSEFIK